jgi:hypothetical protein
MGGGMVQFSPNSALAWGAIIALVGGCSMKRLDLVEETQEAPESDSDSNGNSDSDSELDSSEPGSVTSDRFTSSGASNSTAVGDTSSGVVTFDETSSVGNVTAPSSSNVSLGETSGFEGPQCSPEKPYFIQGECRQCEYPPKPGQCPDGTTCEFFRYVCEPYCSSDRECQFREIEPLPVCDKRYWSCRGCGGDFECDNGLYCIFGRCVPPQSNP